MVGAGGKSRHDVRHASREAVASSLIRAALLGEPGWRTGWDIDDALEARRSVAMESLRERVCRENLPALRCIVGNPFQPVAFDSRWRTEHTVGLAAKMYEDRDFAAMPILADALEEASCDNEAVLSHCREPGPHARGCWVVDGVLSKR